MQNEAPSHRSSPSRPFPQLSSKPSSSTSRSKGTKKAAKTPHIRSSRMRREVVPDNADTATTAEASAPRRGDTTPGERDGESEARSRRIADAKSFRDIGVAMNMLPSRQHHHHNHREQQQQQQQRKRNRTDAAAVTHDQGPVLPQILTPLSSVSTLAVDDEEDDLVEYEAYADSRARPHVLEEELWDSPSSSDLGAFDDNHDDADDDDIRMKRSGDAPSADDVTRVTSTPELIALWNLPVQTHYVQISDGTILTLHRIPCRRSSPTSPPEERPSPAVLVWHGIGLSSNAWVCSPGDRESNLAFVLADAGYDVWLANARGSEYTRRRRRRDSLVTLSSSSLSTSPSFPAPVAAPYPPAESADNDATSSSGRSSSSGRWSSAFTSVSSAGSNPLDEAEQPTWDFSIDEAAHLDVPAVVDYVLEVTGLSSISYIGYSQGTTAIFAALSVNDELNSKLNVAIAMAPALKPKKPRTTLVGSLLRSFGGPDGLYSVFGRGSFIGFARNFKNYMPGRLHVALLDTAFKNVLEWEVHRLGSTQRRAALYYHLFSGTSMKNVVHWFQVIEAGGSFQHYVDRRSSWSDSFVHTSHKISHPIKYPTKHIKTPLHLFVGTKDHISDCDHLREHLPRQTNFHMVDDYTHMDFLWATDVKECVWDNVLDVLSKANELPISE